MLAKDHCFRCKYNGPMVALSFLPLIIDKTCPHGSGVAARGALRMSAQSGSKGAMRLKRKISFLHVKVSTSDRYLEVFKHS